MWSESLQVLRGHEKLRMAASRFGAWFSRERWDEYRRLFEQLGLTDGVVKREPDLVLLTASSRGLVTGGSAKGYVHTVNEPPLLVALSRTLQIRG